MKPLSVKEIKEELTALGIEFDDKLKKDDLMKILESETVEKVETAKVAETVKTEEEKEREGIVIEDFTDLKDGGYVYFKDVIYPRQGVKVDDERFDELASTNNKRRKALIKERD